MRTGAGTSSDTLAPRVRRRRAVGTVLRSLLVSTAITIGYFILPLTSPLATASLLELTLGLAIVAVLLTWQIRGIINSTYPMARAIAALTVTVPLFLAVFATTYYLMGHAEPSTFSEPMTRLDAAYFTVTVFATVGFGDITAVSQSARAVTTVQMMGDIVLVGLIARVVVGAVQEARSRQGADLPR